MIISNSLAQTNNYFSCIIYFRLATVFILLVVEITPSYITRTSDIRHNVCLRVNINPISSPAVGFCFVLFFILHAGCWDCTRNTLALWENLHHGLVLRVTWKYSVYSTLQQPVNSAWRGKALGSCMFLLDLVLLDM